jgi:hypothetical protein
LPSESVTDDTVDTPSLQPTTTAFRSPAAWAALYVTASVAAELGSEELLWR